ncbi:YgcG family protein [Azonexus sp.]|uniref:TPM domain-containing protein n=1 Tax=Azonexus sp. TaxID=1872668 RepID=UPI0027B991CD|nr:YgcG family protein [Azonexus sp.]
MTHWQDTIRQGLFRGLCLAFCLAILPFASLAATATPMPLPELSARVTDLTGTLSAEEKSALTASLAGLEQEKGAQIAILLLPTTQPESIEQFGIRLAETWKIGRKGVDDGVIVIVAKDDRRMRIEVGYGLEGAIPDAVAKRIIEEHMVPHFRDGDFAGGLRSTVEILAKVIGGEALPPPVTRQPNSEASFDTDSLLFIAIFVASIARALFGIAGSLAVSLLAGWLAWMSFGSLIAALIAAVLTFGASFLRSGSGGGWHSGGGRSGGSSGGGGFSGGGGSFGGGGASGRW